MRGKIRNERMYERVRENEAVRGWKTEGKNETAGVRGLGRDTMREGDSERGGPVDTRRRSLLRRITTRDSDQRSCGIDRRDIVFYCILHTDTHTHALRPYNNVRCRRPAAAHATAGPLPHHSTPGAPVSWPGGQQGRRARGAGGGPASLKKNL